MGHIVANVTDDDSVPKNCFWLGNCVEKLAGDMGLALLAYSAKARTDGRSSQSWVRGWRADDGSRGMGRVVVGGADSRGGG